MSDKETSGYSARSSQVSIAFEVRGCPRGRKATISSSASQTEKKVNLGSDLDVKETYMVGVNQYLGRSNAGVGNEVVVRITVDDDKKLKDIEILKQSETGIGAQAIESMPKEMISKNTYEVDSISGASATSRALKEAVKDAMNKI